MKKFLIPFLLTTVIISCNKRDDPRISNGEVQLSIIEKSIEISGRAETDDPSAIILSLESESGEIVLEEELIQITKFADDFLLDPILLEIGNYQLKKFFVLNSSNEVIFATPLEGSVLESFVDNPLPLAFSISADEVTDLGVEVIATNSIDPEDLGYTSISFAVVPTIDILVSVLTQDGSNYQLAESQLTVFADGDSLFTQSLGDSINIVKLRTDFDSYQFLATLTNGATRDTTISSSKIITHRTVPLDILIPSGVSSGVYTLINDKIAKLDGATGNASTALSITNFPSEHKHSALTYNSSTGDFFLIQNTSTAPLLVKISDSGEYTEVGRIMYNGNPVDIAEGLAFDSGSDILYLTASLNGGVPDGDFWSESLLTIDPETANATFLTEIVTSAPTPDSDTDDLVFRDGVLYITDGAPPGANFTTFYSLAVDDIVNGGSTSPTQIFTTIYFTGGRIAVNDDFIYLTSDKSLYKLDRAAPTSLDFVGTTHGISEFDGASILGVVYID